MTIIANRELAYDAKSTRDRLSAALSHLSNLRTNLEDHRYDLAAETVASGQYQSLRESIDSDLAILGGIVRRVDRLAIVLEADKKADLSFAQSQVATALANIHREGKVTTKGQADYFVEQAIRAFGPAAVDAVDRIAVEQVLFALVSNSDERRLRTGTTLDTVRRAVQAAAVVNQ